MYSPRNYLARIGVSGPVTADGRGLRELQRAHLLAVPFENLSIHLGEPITLDQDALAAKIAGRRRGGFCYELNGAFAGLPSVRTSRSLSQPACPTCPSYNTGPNKGAG